MSCLDKIKEYIDCDNSTTMNIYAYYPAGTLHFFKVKPSFAKQPNANKPTLEEMEKDENYICSISINTIINEFLSHRISFLNGDKTRKLPMFHKSKSKGVKLYSEFISVDYAECYREFRSTDSIDDYFYIEATASSVIKFDKGSKGDFLRIGIIKQYNSMHNKIYSIIIAGNPTVILRKKRYLNPIDRFLLHKLNIIDL